MTESHAPFPDSSPARPRRFLEVDVFATGPLTGNPLAVVVDAEGLTDGQMQAVAAWTGFSETTFLLPPTDPAADYRVRIFTLREEFDFAGHPTLGTALAWLHTGGTPRTPGRGGGSTALVQECGAGLVPVTLAGDGLLAFATPPLRRSGPLGEEDVRAIAAGLRIDRDAILDHGWGDNGPGWQLVRVADAEAVRALEPRGHEELKVGVVGLEPEGAETAYEVRAFAYGGEDPVTGSLNGALAQWLRGAGLVPERYVAAQGSQVGRRGRVHVHDDGTDIWIGGRASVVVDGTIAL